MHILTLHLWKLSMGFCRQSYLLSLWAETSVHSSISLRKLPTVLARHFFPICRDLLLHYSVCQHRTPPWRESPVSSSWRRQTRQKTRNKMLTFSLKMVVHVRCDLKDRYGCCVNFEPNDRFPMEFNSAVMYEWSGADVKLSCKCYGINTLVNKSRVFF